MAAKLNLNGPYREFHCPGCKEDHAVDGRWTWSGGVDCPTFQPSVKVENGRGICHFYVRAGKIEFCTDCTAHKFAGQTLDLPDWERPSESDSQGTFEVESSEFPDTEESKPMAEKKEFKTGDKVKLLAPHVAGIAAEVVISHPEDGQFVCRIISSEHPSGHSQEGTLVMFPADQLEPLEQSQLPQINL